MSEGSGIRLGIPSACVGAWCFFLLRDTLDAHAVVQIIASEPSSHPFADRGILNFEMKTLPLLSTANRLYGKKPKLRDCWTSRYIRST